MNITLEYILENVHKYYELEREEILSPSRKEPYKHARYVFCYLARKHTKYSQNAIGDYANLDRATVAYGVNSIKKDLLLYQDVRDDVDAVEALMFTIDNKYLHAMAVLGLGYDMFISKR